MTKRLAEVIKKGLVEEGYSVDIAYDGAEGQYMAESASYDLVILDIMLPKKDGVTICQELRIRGINTPILMLTAKDSVEDRVKGLDSGADDYLVKPFAKASKLQVGNLVMDTLTREVWRGDKKIELTAKEYAILEYFMRHPNMVVTRTMLMEKVWDYDFEGISNVIDVYIRRLRLKLDEEGAESIIETVRGAGYRLREP